MNKKELTFVIVTFNSAKIIEKCLSQINQEKYDIIISDNNSNDKTITLIQEKFPTVKIIQNKKNLGFSRANNIALKQIKTDFTAILNPDCFIDDKSILTIIKTMQQNSQIALSNGINYDCYLEKNQLIISKKEDIAQKNYQKEEPEYFESKFISGACMFIKMKIFKKIGFFDENFFLYCEDNEICKRTKKYGYKLATIKNTQICHLGNQSSHKEYNSKNDYFILWHKLGWSKCYYTEAVHNKIAAKLKAIRNILRILIKFPIKKITGQSLNLAEKAILAGCFAYLIGTKAFDKNDDPQMMP